MKDWQSTPEDYIATLGGLRTGSEVLADLDAERDHELEHAERHAPATSVDERSTP